jgi:hypothetical protein
MDTNEEFYLSYVETALWSSTDDDGEPLDGNYREGDLAPQCRAKMRADCEKFLSEQSAFITEEHRVTESEHSAVAMAAHDFWLTRNGHGAGFWDGDWTDEADEALTAASHAFRECDLYVGDNGLLYLSPGGE